MAKTPADTYNYDTFRPAPYVEGGCEGPKPGQSLANEVVWTTDGSATKLGEVVHRLTVLETGSTTCPLYRGNVRRMRRVANEHPDATFAVLYTREAHPGNRRGPHTGLADKLSAAAELPEQAGEWRPILVDDVEGQLHKRLSGAPNSVLFLDEQATVLGWIHDADPRSVAEALDAVERGDQPLAMSGAFRPPPPWIAVRALLRGGFKALWDFLRGLPALARYRLSGGPDC